MTEKICLICEKPKPLKYLAIIAVILCLLTVNAQAQQATTQYGLSLNSGVESLMGDTRSPAGAGIAFLARSGQTLHMIFLDFSTTEFQINVSREFWPGPIGFHCHARTNALTISYSPIDFYRKDGFGPLVGFGVTDIRVKAKLNAAGYKIPVIGSSTRLTVNFGVCIKVDKAIFRMLYTVTGSDMQPRGVLFGVGLCVN